MRDEAVRVHLKGPDLLVVGVLCAQTAQRARQIHGCMPTSAGLLAEGLAAAFGVAGLLAGQARVNLQVTCDGPVRGLFVDADAQGRGRGYVKNPQVNFLSAGGPFEASGALGRSGVLSIIRELMLGEFYRGSVSLEHFDLPRDLERYYLESEQIATAVSLQILPEGPERLARVQGLFIQAMPDARARDVEKARACSQLSTVDAPARAFDLVKPLTEAFAGEAEILAEYPLDYVCGCSADKVVRAVLAMGRAEIEDMLAKEGHARATCAFCNTVYTVSGEQLRQMIDAIDSSDDEPN
jgi:molecular chaperone Hsp33